MSHYIIGDVHNCKEQLIELVNKIGPTKDDTVVFVGDYIGIGSNKHSAINFIIRMKEYTNVVTLKGDHDGSELNSSLRKYKDFFDGLELCGVAPV